MERYPSDKEEKPSPLIPAIKNIKPISPLKPLKPFRHLSDSKDIDYDDTYDFKSGDAEAKIKISHKMGKPIISIEAVRGANVKIVNGIVTINGTKINPSDDDE